MAHGKAVVATAVGGLKELVSHGRTGLLVEPENPQALRSAIAELLGDAALRRRSARRARRGGGAVRVENVTAATVIAYRDAIGRTSTPAPPDESTAAAA